MTPKFYLKLYGIALAAFLVIDLFWIGFFANGFYRDRLGHLLAEAPNLAAAIVFYLMFIAGLVFFAVVPGLKKSNALPGLFNAAVFGIVTYGTYDLTSLALIRDWPVSVTIVDMVWGMSVSVMVTGITMTAGRSRPRQDH